MPAPQIIGNPWGRPKTWETDDGSMTFQGYDYGYQITTNESVSDGWYGIDVKDDPDGDPDVIYVNGRKFRAAPD